ncbi:hypothetical protein BBK82_46550 [Lentzea guizhouensis]|uniref:Uncharacterized protein n=1 Tax=Lentzea guizhouensis TaxID=1586287 RepID=A0A1B2HX55_9PSEU|nr:hypothetical protein [Lentzea guizhouensis]ANZ42284.1 hypothetical protein BBK82_46550 [Lentzea guizhouensis]
MRTAALPVAAALALTACGHPTELEDQPMTTPMNDPALMTAADAIVPVLERRFADFYAGLRVRNEVPELVVYRKPDPELDAEITELGQGARIVFQDAKYTLVELKASVSCAMGVPTVVIAGPAVEGSGVRVTTTGDPATVVADLETRCPGMDFHVEQGEAPVPAGRR